MSKWETVKLGDICTMVTGGTPSTSVKSYWDNGKIPWLPSGVCQNAIIDKSDTFITKEGLNNSSAKIMPINTVVIALTGATTGKVGILKIEACANQSVTGILPNDTLHYKYIFYYLLFSRSKIMNDSYGGAQKHISQRYVKDFQIPLPPLEIQKKIATNLDKLTHTIYLCNQIIEKLDLLVKARFVEMFGELGTDKFGWGLEKIGNISEINPKKAKDNRLYSDLEVSFVPMTAVSEKGDIDTSEIKTYDEVKKGFTYFAENDILFAKITPCMENGKGCIAHNLYNGIGFGSTEFHVLRPSEKINSYWLYIITTFKEFRENACANMTGSAGQRRVPAKFLENYKITVPPIELQNQFADFVEQNEKSKSAVKKVLEKAETLKKTLMQEYFG